MLVDLLTNCPSSTLTFQHTTRDQASHITIIILRDLQFQKLLTNTRWHFNDRNPERDVTKHNKIPLLFWWPHVVNTSPAVYVDRTSWRLLLCAVRPYRQSTDLANTRSTLRTKKNLRTLPIRCLNHTALTSSAGYKPKLYSNFGNKILCDQYMVV